MSAQVIFMAFLKADIYQKTIFDVDYKKLKQDGIKCLVFDLDNTLSLIDEDRCPKETKKLLEKLKKDFFVFICSNNNKERIIPFVEELKIEGEAFSLKPIPKGLMRIRKKCGIKKKEMVMIGDQLVTDVLSGKIYGVCTVLVDPLGDKDLKITGLNRKIERLILKKYEKDGVFKRGSYYE